KFGLFGLTLYRSYDSSMIPLTVPLAVEFSAKLPRPVVRALLNDCVTVGLSGDGPMTRNCDPAMSVYVPKFGLNGRQIGGTLPAPQNCVPVITAKLVSLVNVKPQ